MDLRKDAWFIINTALGKVMPGSGLCGGKALARERYT